MCRRQAALPPSDAHGPSPAAPGSGSLGRVWDWQMSEPRDTRQGWASAGGHVLREAQACVMPSTPLLTKPPGARPP